MNKLFSRMAVTAVILALPVLAQAADPQAERVQGFKDAKHSVGQIKDALSAGKTATVAASAQSLAAFGARIPSLFPQGSNKGETEAKDEIWSNFSDFEAKSKTFETRSTELAQLASSGADKTQLTEAFGKVVDSCKACHRSFKEDK